MSVKIRCPSCSAIHAVHHRVLGKTIKCPECGGSIQVPTSEQIEAARKPKEVSASFEMPIRVAASAPRATKPTVSTAQNEAQQEKALSNAITSFRRPEQPPQEDMDMTPMVDVTFLLLIFFMITASFAVQKSIQRPTQKSDQPSTTVQVQEEDKDSVIIQVDEFNAYNVLISGTDYPAGSKQDLIVKLTDFQATTTAGERATKLIIDAHENCIHSAVVDALDSGREAGFESFEVRTVEQFD